MNVKNKECFCQKVCVSKVVVTIKPLSHIFASFGGKKENDPHWPNSAESAFFFWHRQSWNGKIFFSFCLPHLLFRHFQRWFYFIRHKDNLQVYVDRNNLTNFISKAFWGFITYFTFQCTAKWNKTNVSFC